jgi:hypothetical protein
MPIIASHIREQHVQQIANDGAWRILVALAMHLQSKKMKRCECRNALQPAVPALSSLTSLRSSSRSETELLSELT